MPRAGASTKGPGWRSLKPKENTMSDTTTTAKRKPDFIAFTVRSQGNNAGGND